MFRYLDETDQGQIWQWVDNLHPGGFHPMSAEPDELGIRPEAQQFTYNRRPVEIARFFTCRQKYPHRQSTFDPLLTHSLPHYYSLNRKSYMNSAGVHRCPGRKLLSSLYLHQPGFAVSPP